MIKEIPIKIKNKIIKEYIKEAYNTRTRYFSYLTEIKKDIAKITVAIKKYKNNYLIKQVAIHTLKEECYSRDLTYYYISGYTTDWTEEINSKQPIDYTKKQWFKCEYKYFNPQAELVNIEFLDKFPQYKYSCYKQYNNSDILRFLKLYSIYPEIEILMKLDLQGFALNIPILKKLHTEKRFKKFICNNKNEIKKIKPYTLSILQAYKTNKPIQKIDKINKFKQEIKYYKELIKEFSYDMEKFLNYLDEQNIQPSFYEDYFKACNLLQIDIKINKNRYPKNFMQWHDIRIDQANTKKAELDKLEHKKLYSDFKKISEKYLPLQQISQQTFIAIIAKNPQELKNEGNILHHCVGTMNYDKKMIKEESLIFFIRKKERPTIPYVTLEYSIKTKKILQCYADYNLKPNSETINYIYENWLPFANKQLTKLLTA